MSTILQEPRLQRTESPAPFTRLGPQRTSASPRPPLGTVLLATLRSVCEKALGLLLGILSFALRFAGYAACVLAVPLAPFVLPLLVLLPVVVAFGLVILDVGAFLGVLGWP